MSFSQSSTSHESHGGPSNAPPRSPRSDTPTPLRRRRGPPTSMIRHPRLTALAMDALLPTAAEAPEPPRRPSPEPRDINDFFDDILAADGSFHDLFDSSFSFDQYFGAGRYDYHFHNGRVDERHDHGSSSSTYHERSFWAEDDDSSSESSSSASYVGSESEDDPPPRYEPYSSRTVGDIQDYDLTSPARGEMAGVIQDNLFRSMREGRNPTLQAQLETLGVLNTNLTRPPSYTELAEAAPAQDNAQRGRQQERAPSNTGLFSDPTTRPRGHVTGAGEQEMRPHMAYFVDDEGYRSSWLDLSDDTE